MNSNKSSHSFVESKWNRLYQKIEAAIPADVLIENSFLLPKTGVALDLACGLGGNALFLAEHDLSVHAWDVSLVALNKLEKNAAEKGLEMVIKQVFIDPSSLPKNTFDVIVLSRFLDRSLCNAIIECLKPDGLLFYQTYVREKISNNGPKNPEYLLARNELLTLFQPLRVVVYRENSLIGNLECGERNEAFYVGQK